MNIGPGSNTPITDLRDYRNHHAGKAWVKTACGDWREGDTVFGLMKSTSFETGVKGHGGEGLGEVDRDCLYGVLLWGEGKGWDWEHRDCGWGRVCVWGYGLGERGRIWVWGNKQGLCIWVCG